MCVVKQLRYILITTRLNLQAFCQYYNHSHKWFPEQWDDALQTVVLENFIITRSLTGSGETWQCFSEDPQDSEDQGRPYLKYLALLHGLFHF